MGHVAPALEAGVHQEPWQPPSMVQVKVGHQHQVDLLRVDVVGKRKGVHACQCGVNAKVQLVRERGCVLYNVRCVINYKLVLQL